jgi:hypothetical protein
MIFGFSPRPGETADVSGAVIDDPVPVFKDAVNPYNGDNGRKHKPEAARRRKFREKRCSLRTPGINLGELAITLRMPADASPVSWVVFQ